MSRGLFLTLEGPDGCGKTTQAKRLAAALERAAIPHLLTREPGGSPIGEKIRAILVDPGNAVLDARAETFLFMANRAQNLAEIVRPALAEGKVVLSDRHRDSSVAFQGGGRQLGFDYIETLNTAACGDLVPDATLYFDIPVSVSVARARGERQDHNVDGQGDRFEREARAFHQRVFDAYHTLIRRDPDRFLVIDATGSVEDVTARALTTLAQRFPEQLGRLAPTPPLSTGAPPAPSASVKMMAHGALSSQLIRQLARLGKFADTRGPLEERRIQPASADLTLSEWGFCVKSAFLPNPDESVETAVMRYALFPLDLNKPRVLNLGSTYVFRLNERLRLSDDLYALFSPKSSIGRLNVWVRTLADRVSRFDRIPPGYDGPLYIMVTPKSWPVIIEAGLSLNQIRFFTTGGGPMSRFELRLLHDEIGLMNNPASQRIAEPHYVDDGILLTTDLSGETVAYQAKHSIDIVDLTRTDASHDPLDFFDPIRRAKDGALVLKEREFYLIPTYEYFRVPLDYCVEMVAYDVASGEFRSHYAGFFDPGFGFGAGEVPGTPATLEVIPHESVILRHRQPVCKMVFERLVARPDKVYGASTTGSHYQHQRGPALSKYFRSTRLNEPQTDDRKQTTDPEQTLADRTAATAEDQPPAVAAKGAATQFVTTGSDFPKTVGATAGKERW